MFCASMLPFILRSMIISSISWQISGIWSSAVCHCGYMNRSVGKDGNPYPFDFLLSGEIGPEDGMRTGPPKEKTTP
jgi:hypothetical protein